MSSNPPKFTAVDEQAAWNPALRPDSNSTGESSEPVQAQQEEPPIEDVNTALAARHSDLVPEVIASEQDASFESTAVNAVQEPITEPATQNISTREEYVTPSSPVDSGDEWTAQDRIDPAWGLESTAAVLHTNSFPPVPPLDSSSMPAAQPLPHSQVEDIMEEVENNDDAEIVTAQNNEDNDDRWGQELDGFTADDFFSKVNDVESSVPMEPNDEEARYEEGIPLVQDTAEAPNALADRKVAEIVEDTPNSFDSGFDEEPSEDDFFSQVSSANRAPLEPPSLDRKSTQMVMSSMDFPTNNGASEVTQAPTSTDGPLTPDDIGAGQQADTTGTSKEEDLAALWEAALGDDELLVEDEPGMDPSAFFEDDGEGFLDDTADTSVQETPVTASAQVQSQPRQTSAYAPSNAYAPTQPQRPGPQPNSYAPNTSLGFSHGVPLPYGQAAYGQPQAPPSRPSMPDKAQSFADKAKGGYSSPFDAPMDLSRPKRRPAQFQAPLSNRDGQRPPPPPRSSSIQSPASPPSNQIPYSPQANQASGPRSAGPLPGTGSGGPRPPPKSSASGFFEELPMTVKARPSPPGGRFVPQPAQPTPPPSRGAPAGPPPVAQPPQQQNSFGLVAPERGLSFNESLQAGAPQQTQPSQQPIAPPRTAPPPNSRYSPAPGAQQQNPAQNRYAASGGPVRSPSVTLPHLPRTSSPLARSASVTHGYEPQAPRQFHSPSAYTPDAARNIAPSSSQAPPSGPPKRASYAPAPSALSGHQDAASIERPNVTQRGLIQEPSSYPALQPSPEIQRSLRAQGPPADANFIPPIDGHEHDPLKRWQGAPIFQFGFGGNITVSFPQRIPRFSSGQMHPMIKCSPGTIRIAPARIIPIDEHLTAFPGPLKSKSKKKEVSEWLQKGIQQLEQQYIQSVPHETPVDVRKRHEEKVLLWKVLSVMVEFDGNVDGISSASQAIRKILSPELAFDGPANQLSYSSDILPTGITRNSESQPTTPAGVEAVESLRKLLLLGEREKAVWFAVDQKLWGHAMLIASTLPREIWTQVAQEFVKLDVKPIGDNTESLAALYDVFAGNWEESVDRLVPPSARAGLQLVSKTAMSGPAKNAFDGLDRWRETLSLILSNRSAEDARSMIALGQMLSNYGRIEAAHICYLFARTPGAFAGADDPQAQIVLLGADHKHSPSNYGKDLEALCLSEIYDFVLSTLNPLPASGHLQPFKLYHATILADHGSRDVAQQYCDAIAASMKASTKVSPYNHGRLFSALDDLSARLRQAPKDGSGSWIPKPSMDKVSSSFFNKFTSFVAGDDSDAASVGSAQPEAQGPFARISGDSPPTLSRPSSPGDAINYGSMGGYTPMTTSAPTNSRYAPGNTYSPRTSLDQPTLNRQPSNLSMQSGSPDLTRTQSHNFGGAYQPSPSFQSPTSSQKSYSPEIPAHSRFQNYSQRPTSQEAHLSQLSQVSNAPSSPPADGPRLSPYEPRRGSHQSSQGSNYDAPPAAAARSASYGPRSYAPSPGNEKPAVYSPTPSASYEPQAPHPDGDARPASSGGLAPPTIEHQPPTPVKAHSDSPSFGYDPTPIQANEPAATEEPTSQDSFGYQSAQSSYVPTASSYEPPTSSHGPPASSDDAPNHEESGDSSYQPPTSSYEPPSSGYEPPSYQPYQPETNGEATGAPSSPIKKKKSFMDLSDDEDDLSTRAASLKQKSKAEKDREAEEAFRRAAEADASRDDRPGLQAKSSGWFSGGWFRKGGSPAPEQQTKAIKAKLGDESSFYFDKNIGKWVNKNASGDQAAPSAPTPPPPRGPPSRAVSSSSLGAGPPMGAKPPTSAPSGPPMGGPPSNPASRNVSPSLGSTPPIGSGPPGMTPSGLAPPSRPGTGMSGVSNASSIDDLIGVPQARKGGTMKKTKKRSGYVDIMAKD